MQRYVTIPWHCHILLDILNQLPSLLLSKLTCPLRVPLSCILLYLGRSCLVHSVSPSVYVPITLSNKFAVETPAFVFRFGFKILLSSIYQLQIHNQMLFSWHLSPHLMDSTNLRINVALSQRQLSSATIFLFSG